MVTILEPKTDPKPRLEPEPKVVGMVAEAVPPLEEVQARVGYLEMRYAMPFAGVRYYAFRPCTAAIVKHIAPDERGPKQLAARLIDEKVILL